MVNKKTTRPRAARRRTLPPDATSLETMFRSVHADLIRRAEHLIVQAHDAHARRGLLALYEQRAACYARIAELAPAAALRLAAEFDLMIPEIRTEVR